MKKALGALAIAALGIGMLQAAGQTQKSEMSGGSGQTQKSTQGFSGSKWNVTLTPDEASAARGITPFTDVLIFDNGKMTAPECLKYGFKTSSFKSSRKGEGMEFTTTQKSEQEGTGDWTGLAVGDALNGMLVWTKKDGGVATYRMTGKRQ
jgi:hypothetical protein